MVLVYIFIYKNIIIRRSTIVVLPNAFLTDAPQLQNSILPLGARNYSMISTSRLGSVDNLNLNP